MSNRNSGLFALICTIAGGVAFVAVLALVIVGDYNLSPAVFLGGLVAAGVALFLLVSWGSGSDPKTALAHGTAAQGRVSDPRPDRTDRDVAHEDTVAGAPAMASDPVVADTDDSLEADPVMPSDAHEPAPVAAPAEDTVAASEADTAIAETPPREDSTAERNGVASASGGVAVGASGDVRPKVSSTPALKGEEELSNRKGGWTYRKDGPPAGAAENAASPSGTASESATDATQARSDGPVAVDGGAAGSEAGAQTAMASGSVAPHDGSGTPPPRRDAPREGGADDLKRIKGVGPKLEGMLNEMGYYHFDQVAAWSDREVAWVDDNLEGFKGRVSRDEWVPQARALADGETPEAGGDTPDGDGDHSS